MEENALKMFNKGIWKLYMLFKCFLRILPDDNLFFFDFLNTQPTK